MSMFVTVKATAATDGLSLDDCRTILDELNQEYGMNYMIPSEDIAKATQMDLKVNEIPIKKKNFFFKFSFGCTMS